MDKIHRLYIDDAADAFIASIDLLKICNLASTFHPEHKPCRLVDNKPRKGSYNVCFLIVFLSDGSDTEEKWVIRIPLIPRLAFPEEKTRSEIATMKYIASNTTIPIPNIHGYGFRQTHPSGLTFMLISYLPGNTLSDIDLTILDSHTRSHIYSQLADIFIQLRRCEFPHIGSLTLDPSDDQTPIFAHNRGLDININDYELGGLDATSIIGPSKIYTTAIDYLYTLTELLFNQFDKQTNCIYNEADARYNLYGLHQFRSILMGWLRRETNEGPFLLTHGDFRRRNILVDQDMNITGVLDWEWSRTVPVQMFVPPPWLKGGDINGLLGFNGLAYTRELRSFRDIVEANENTHYDQTAGEKKIPLSKLWTRITDSDDFYIAHALLRLDTAADIYWDAIDNRHYGEDQQGRVKLFYEVSATSDQNKRIEKKLQELKAYQARLKEKGLEDDKPLKSTPRSSTDKKRKRTTFPMDISLTTRPKRADDT
ncbi:hypothetical protein B7463_g4775, partial [Scytalidium lignicola]